MLQALLQTSRCTRHAALARAFSGSALPIIDVSALLDPSAPGAARLAAGARLHEACLRSGFFYAAGHGLPAEVTDGVLAAARTWFTEVPEAEKARLALSPGSHYRGWQRLGLNVTQGRPDLHEAIDLYREVDPGGPPPGGRPSPLHGRNPWPTQVPGFEAALRAYIAGCLRLGAAIMRGLALGLGLPEGYFGGGQAGDSYWVARAIYYPPLPEAAAGRPPAGGAQEPLSCGEHTDYGLLTLVNQEPHVSALQVLSAGGAWVDAAPVPGTLVCNVGDMARVYTNGLYQPTLHRVVLHAHPTASRVSTPFFYEPNFEALVAPAPALCGGRPPAVAPMRYGDHLESKVTSNFLREKA